MQTQVQPARLTPGRRVGAVRLFLGGEWNAGAKSRLSYDTVTLTGHTHIESFPLELVN